jgi:hypothetical protein
MCVNRERERKREYDYNSRSVQGDYREAREEKRMIESE